MKQREMNEPNPNIHQSTSAGSFGTDVVHPNNNNNNNNNTNDYPQTPIPNPAPIRSTTPSSMSTTGTCFFADATLDLEEAHGMADMTPDVSSQRKMSDMAGGGGGDDDARNQPAMIGGRRADSLKSLLELPSLTEQQQQKHHNRHHDNDNASSPRMNRSLKQVTSNSINNTENNDSSNPSNLPTYRPRAPRYPRDVGWTVAFALYIPLTLILPLHLPHHNHPPSNTTDDNDENDAQLLTSSNIGNWTKSLSRRTPLLFNTTSILLLSILFLARTLYLSRGGGDGDDARYRASTLLLVASSLTWIPFGILGLQVYWLEVHDDDGDGKLEGKGLLGSLTLGLFGVALWELFVFSNWIYDSSGTISSSDNTMNNHHHARGGGREHYSPTSIRARMLMGNTSNRLWNGRKMAFFRELASTSLDILSRSLRCQSFYRVVCGLVAVQFVLVWMWHNALLRVMRRAVVVANSGGGGGRGGWDLGIVLICVAGWWGSSVIRRILGLIASGGITSWFAQQSLLLEEMEQIKMEKEGRLPASSNNSATGLSNENFGSSGNTVRNNLHLTMPEAYRVDASAYSSAIEFDEGIDDDYEDDEDLYGGGSSSRMKTNDNGRMTFSRSDGNNSHRAGQTEWTGGGSGGASTVKAFLVSSLTVSLGSVAKCALMGGLAQIIWWFCHKVDKLKLLSARYIPRRSAGYQGMSVGSIGGVNASSTGSDKAKERLGEMYRKVDTIARNFVRNNSELALCHVAAYFKSYRRAANDVMVLLDDSGVEPIMHKDISSHMCSAISKSITAILTIVSGQILLARRTGEVSDVVICETMIISYIMCYTILFTIMEPLRASIAAVYVCFAQHPQSLSQAFPLVYQRLSRISEDNNMT